MPRFTAVHSIPFTEDALVQLATEEAPKFPEKGLTWLRTHCDFDGNKFFCEWEGPDKDAIEDLLNGYSIPFDGVYPVRIFDVATAQFED